MKPADASPNAERDRPAAGRYEVRVGRFGLIDALRAARDGGGTVDDAVPVAVDELLQGCAPRQLSTLVAVLEGRWPPCATWDDLSAIVDDLEYLQYNAEEWPPWMDAALSDCADAGVLTGPMVQRVQRHRGDRWVLDAVAGCRADARWVRSVTLTDATDAELARLSLIGHLKTVHLDLCKQMTDQGLSHVARLSQLTNLNLDWCHQVTDVGLSHVAGRTQLTLLNLGCCNRVTNKSLAHVARLAQLTNSRLTNLNIDWCRQVADAGLSHVSRLTQLTPCPLAEMAIHLAISAAHLSGEKNPADAISRGLQWTADDESLARQCFGDGSAVYPT